MVFERILLTVNTDLLCTAEMSTAVIVVSLPGLKSFIMRSRTPEATKDNSAKSLGPRPSTEGHTRSHIQLLNYQEAPNFL